MTKSNLRAHRSVLQRLYFLKQDGEYARIYVSLWCIQTAIKVLTTSSYRMVFIMWGSRLRARSASDIFDPSTLFCSSNQTQDGWSSNGPTLHLLSFSVCLPSTLHSRTATTICRLRDDGTSSSSFFLWELLNISSHGNLSESDCTFSFFFSVSWESARGRAGGQGEGTASRGRAEGRRKTRHKGDAEKDEKKE